MKHLRVQFKAEDTNDDAGVFTGYASVFKNRDLGGDVVLPGAFKRTIEHNGGRFPLLADHNFTLAGRLGYVEAEEVSKGLKVTGHFNLEKQVAREVYSDVKQSREAGIPLGMSIGYEPVVEEFDKNSKTRLLKEVKLYEATITQFPMNPKARITSVKEALESADLNPFQILHLIEELKALLPSDPLGEHSDDHGDGASSSEEPAATETKQEANYEDVLRSLVEDFQRFAVQA